MGKNLFILPAIALSAIAVCAAPIAAQTVVVDNLACVPLQPHDANKNHALVTASVTGAQVGEVRLYFRRLNPDVEDFYYSIMQSSGGGSYWGVLPDPEDREVQETDPAVWKTHQAGDPDRSRVGSSVERDWLNEGSQSVLADWLAEQKSEPVEYYAALYDVARDSQAQSELKIASVREDCRATLDSKQIGEAKNQTIGETAQWQNDKIVYHWECDHLVSRINYLDVKEADSICRAVVVANNNWIPMRLVGASLAGIVLCSETVICEGVNSPSEP